MTKHIKSYLFFDGIFTENQFEVFPMAFDKTNMSIGPDITSAYIIHGKL